MQSRCDVCSVAADSGAVVICFGEREAAAIDSRAVGVALRHRIRLPSDAAATLQDMMAALLDETADAGAAAATGGRRGR